MSCTSSAPGADGNCNSGGNFLQAVGAAAAGTLQIAAKASRQRMSQLQVRHPMLLRYGVLIILRASASSPRGVQLPGKLDRLVSRRM
jgi:hypothetical protein